MSYRTSQGPVVECFECHEVVPLERSREMGEPMEPASRNFCVVCYVKRLKILMEEVVAYTRGE